MNRKPCADDCDSTILMIESPREEHMDNSNGVDLSDLIVFAYYLTGIVMVLRMSRSKIAFYGMMALAFNASWMIFDVWTRRGDAGALLTCCHFRWFVVGGLNEGTSNFSTGDSNVMGWRWSKLVV